MTIARSWSTNALTYSYRPIATGQSTIISERHSITHMLVTPTNATAVNSPAGPAMCNKSPLLCQTVTPIIAEIARPRICHAGRMDLTTLYQSLTTVVMSMRTYFKAFGARFSTLTTSWFMEPRRAVTVERKPFHTHPNLDPRIGSAMQRYCRGRWLRIMLQC
jgi:hypothetical protein